MIPKIPESGKIYFLKNQQQKDKDAVLNNWSKTLFLKNSETEQKRWLMDIVEEKIRQQLQVLKDKGYLRFTRRGNYEVI